MPCGEDDLDGCPISRDEVTCSVCGDDYSAAWVKDGVCQSCSGKRLFGAFAKQHGLPMFPDPTGERYVYNADGSFAGKKAECQSMMDELWNALVKSQSRADLVIG